MRATTDFIVRAIKTLQGDTQIFAFFIPGARVLEIADISRLERADFGSIIGFQRPEIRSHVKHIVEYLNRGSVLFPNAIIMALAPGVRFNASRGTKPTGAGEICQAGTLYIPVRPGRKAAWIVDGQQRTLALAETSNASLPVPIIAFVSGDLSVHREQFILVNKARPLSSRLIDELLPTVGSLLPRELSIRRIPSILCNLLNDSSDSPFYKLIRRPSCEWPSAVIIDSSLIKSIKRSIQDPRGALAAHVSGEGADLDAMYRVLVIFWGAVKDAFPDAWALPPERSRLMHSAGVEAMGVLMDQIMNRADVVAGSYSVVLSILRGIAPGCRWTNGYWETLGREWNEIQCTTKDVRALSNLLVSMERDLKRSVAA